MTASEHPLNIVTAPTWVPVAGYSIEKIHTGVLVHPVRRGSVESLPLVNTIADGARHRDEVHSPPRATRRIVVASGIQYLVVPRRTRPEE